jgi:hypothetical protein
MAFMLTSSSGRSNFGNLMWEDSALEEKSPDLIAALNSGCSAQDAALVTESKVVQMLKRENELRLSDTVQALLDTAASDKVEAIYLAIQRQAAREAGYEDWRVFGVRVLRCAQVLFPQSDAVRTVPLYVRHNRAVDGALHVGDLAPVDELFLGAMPAGLGLSLGEGHDSVLRPFPKHVPSDSSTVGVRDDATAAASLGLQWSSLREHLAALRDREQLAQKPIVVLAGSAT